MKKKNLKVAFCNATKPHHYKSSDNDTVLIFFNKAWHGATFFDAEVK